jgi:hypothetical protein
MKTGEIYFYELSLELRQLLYKQSHEAGLEWMRTAFKRECSSKMEFVCSMVVNMNESKRLFWESVTK